MEHRIQVGRSCTGPPHTDDEHRMQVSGSLAPLAPLAPFALSPARPLTPLALSPLRLSRRLVHSIVQRADRKRMEREAAAKK